MWNRLQLESPLRQQRLAAVLALSAALLVAMAVWLRHGASGRNWTSILDVLALFLSIVAVIFEVKSASILSDFSPIAARRRALLLTLVGSLTALIVCSLLAWGPQEDATWISMLTAAGLILGFTAAIAGIVSLFLTYGSGYAADRIERLIDDERGR